MNDDILSLKSVSKRYVTKKSGRKVTIQALSNVSFTIGSRRIVALVGESGSGKTTLARLITGIETMDQGQIMFDKRPLQEWRRLGLREYRKHVQIVFQDPFAALNALNTVGYSLSRPIVNYRHVKEDDLNARVEEIMALVHLTPAKDFVAKLPFQLSGGQLQRVVIARAIASNPKLIVADEPVSMLDVSIRAGILQLLGDLRIHQGVSFLYITHDLISARMIADDILVLYRGTVVEQGDANEVAKAPLHPYSQLLLESIPDPWNVSEGRDAVLPFSGAGVQEEGCVFATRCPHVMRNCTLNSPTLQAADGNRSVACFLYHDNERPVYHPNHLEAVPGETRS